MTLIDAYRHIARHHAAQLRRNPVRLWPLVEQEQTAARLLFLASGRIVRTAPLTVDPRCRL